MTTLISMVLAVLASTALGFFWYSKSLFGTQWMDLMEMDSKIMKEQNKTMGKTYTLMLLGSFVQVGVLNMLLGNMNISTMMGAATLAFWLWLGFVAVTQLSDSIFSGKQFKPALWTINISYQLVSILLMSIILVSL